MSSLIPGYAYDIFISYRQKDNKYDGWVTEFVANLKKELDATFKEDISIYFDENPHDGLLETHDVDQSLNEKVKCLIFLPIVSQTYCDPNAFAWQKEFLAFRNFARGDRYGLDLKLSNGNVTKRILPVRIHEIDTADKQLFEKEVGGVLRPIDFILKAGGINRPLRDKDDNIVKDYRQPFYRDNVNKVANAIKEIILSLTQKETGVVPTSAVEDKPRVNPLSRLGAELIRRNVVRVAIVYLLTFFLLWNASELLIRLAGAPENLSMLVSTVLSILFPLAITMAWLYERSPSGFVRYGSAESLDNPFNSNQRKPLTGDFSILFLMVITISIYLATTGAEAEGSRQPAGVIRLSLLLDHEPSEFDISDDGSRIVYSPEGSNLPLFVRNLDEDLSKPLASTEGGSAPVFSPDGNLVGYSLTGGAWFKTSLDRSDPLKVADDLGVGNVFWDTPDTVVVSLNLGPGLFKKSVTSGEGVAIQFPGGIFAGASPIPGTDYLIGNDENSNITVVSRAGVVSKVVVPNGGWRPRYVEPGYLVYGLQGRLLAVPFDKWGLRTLGPPVPVLGKVKTFGLSYSAFYDIAANGTLVYSPATPNDLVRFIWVDESGNVSDSLSLPAGYYGAFSLSPDGNRLAYGLNGPNSDIWIHDLISGRNMKLTDEGVSQFPVWSPDGQWLTYSCYLNGEWDIYRHNVQLTEQREKLTTSGNLKRPGTWSPDGKLLTFYEVVEGESDNLYVLSRDSKDITDPWRNTKSPERQPRFSPNGKLVCYMAGATELYVEPFPPTGQRWSIGTGVDPIWSPSGGRVFCRSAGANDFSFVDLVFSPDFSVTLPRKMFSGPYIDVFDKSFGVSTDGERFLVLKTVNANERTTHLEVILNWTEELKRLVPLPKN